MRGTESEMFRDMSLKTLLLVAPELEEAGRAKLAEWAATLPWKYVYWNLTPLTLLPAELE